MKIFQVIDGLCHWDATKVCPNIETTREKFPPDCIFVEAPDYVFEGWGYDAFREGEDRFLKPTPPPGWLYDTKTGTFFPEGGDPPLPADPMECIRDFKMALDIIADGL